MILNKVNGLKWGGMTIKYYVHKARAESDRKGTNQRLHSCWRRKMHLPVYKMF